MNCFCNVDSFNPYLRIVDFPLSIKVTGLWLERVLSKISTLAILFAKIFKIHIISIPEKDIQNRTVFFYIHLLYWISEDVESGIHHFLEKENWTLSYEILSNLFSLIPRDSGGEFSRMENYEEKPSLFEMPVVIRSTCRNLFINTCQYHRKIEQKIN